MTQTITEQVYDELTHKLRQWDKMSPAPHELLGALKSWAQLGNADIEAAAKIEGRPAIAQMAAEARGKTAARKAAVEVLVAAAEEVLEDEYGGDGEYGSAGLFTRALRPFRVAVRV